MLVVASLTARLDPETLAVYLDVTGGAGRGVEPAMVAWGGGTCINADAVPGVDFDFRMQISWNL